MTVFPAWISATKKILHLAAMAALTLTKITADGTYTIATPPGRYMLGIGGTSFGSGSLAINWIDAYGNAIPITGSPKTAVASPLEILVPLDAGISLVLAGSTNPVITVALTRL